jgi:hypothetical protein
MRGADLTGVNLRNTDLSSAVGLDSAVFSPATYYNQWTQFPPEFDPIAAELRLVGVTPMRDR